MKETTELRQKRIIEYFIFYKEDHNGIPPTVREVAKAIGTPSSSVAFYHLKKLEEKGLLTKRCGGYDLSFGGWSLIAGEGFVFTRGD